MPPTIERRAQGGTGRGRLRTGAWLQVAREATVDPQVVAPGPDLGIVRGYRSEVRSPTSPSVVIATMRTARRDTENLGLRMRDSITKGHLTRE